MKAADLIRLLDAGFTKEDILSIISPSAPAAEEQAPDQPAPAAAETVETPKAAEAEKPAEPQTESDIYKMLSDKIDSKFNEMAEAFKVPLMPSMGEIKPQGIDDIVRRFFKED